MYQEPFGRTRQNVPATPISHGGRSAAAIFLRTRHGLLGSALVPTADALDNPTA